MTDNEFHNSRSSNGFDRLKVDVDELYRRHPVDSKESSGVDFIPQNLSHYDKIYRSRLMPLETKSNLRLFLTRTHVDDTWFKEFGGYWHRILGGRPLYGVADFHSLRSIYRQQFQNNIVPERADVDAHVRAWQQPELIHNLTHYLYREVCEHDLWPLQQIRKHAPRCRSVLEFGCSMASTTMRYITYFRPRGVRFFISDIKHVTFHYAAYRFRHDSHVVPLLLRQEDDLQLNCSDKFDVIICRDVFEHLNDPLNTIGLFHDHLNAGGILLFNYIKGDGPDGMDTERGHEDREKVLEFIADHFTLESAVNPSESVGDTVARKS